MLEIRRRLCWDAAPDRLKAAASASPAHGDSFGVSAWVLPKNHQSIRDAIVNNLSQPLSATAEAPLDRSWKS